MGNVDLDVLVGLNTLTLAITDSSDFSRCRLASMIPSFRLTVLRDLFTETFNIEKGEKIESLQVSS